jgi:hypothetical protein
LRHRMPVRCSFEKGREGCAPISGIKIWDDAYK